VEDKQSAKEVAERIVIVATKWRSEIRSSHLYPSLEFKGRGVVPKLPMRDFEAYAEMMSWARRILEDTAGRDSARELFLGLERPSKVGVFFNLASEKDSHGRLRTQSSFLKIA